MATAGMLWFFAMARHVRALFRLQVVRDRLQAVLRAEYDVDVIADVRTGIVSSLRTRFKNLILPGTAVPGYRLSRPCGTCFSSRGLLTWWASFIRPPEADSPFHSLGRATGPTNTRDDDPILIPGWINKERDSLLIQKRLWSQREQQR
jgi:hypothetical protein